MYASNISRLTTINRKHLYFDQILRYVGGVDSMSTGQHQSDYNYAFSDIAVLYRTHRVAHEIIRQLQQKGIPVLLSDGTSFFSEPPFDTIAHALQILQDKNNMIAISSLAEHLTGEKASLQQLKNYLEDGQTPFEKFSSHQCWQDWVCLYQPLADKFNTNELPETMHQLLNFFCCETDLTEE